MARTPRGDSAPITIMRLFDACPDDALIRPRDIVSSTGFKLENVRAALKRLVARGKLFRVGYGYYGRRADLVPPRKIDRVEALERAVEALKARCTCLETLVKHYQEIGRL